MSRSNMAYWCARELIEFGFEYVNEINGCNLYRTKK